eukprot:9469859-Pyramimonas_sp.AAC.1
MCAAAVRLAGCTRHNPCSSSAAASSSSSVTLVGSAAAPLRARSSASFWSRSDVDSLVFSPLSTLEQACAGRYDSDMRRFKLMLRGHLGTCRTVTGPERVGASKEALVRCEKN